MLKINYIGDFNPFDWDAFRCPVCKGKEFTSHSHSVVFCDGCGCKFQVRPTCGDPGCVVDAIVYDDIVWVSLPGKTDEDIMEQYPSSYTLILKTEDYCSSWFSDTNNCGHCCILRLNFPTQEEWDLFQGREKERHYSFKIRYYNKATEEYGTEFLSFWSKLDPQEAEVLAEERFEKENPDFVVIDEIQRVS